MQNIFDSLKVIELASVLAGPSVGQFFAELGAEVIKVENPHTGGDVTRSWSLLGENPEQGVTAYFSAVNAGKRSIQLDLKSSEDIKTLHGLISEADLLITSFKPGDAEKLGLAYEQLKGSYPQLIYAEISGYGEQNAKVGYDAVLQAETGFMSINGLPNGESLKMPVALIDILAAHQLKEAVLLAYIHRMKRAKGSKVSVSLFDAAVSSLANQATNFLVGGKVPQKMGAEHPNIAPYGKLYTCSEGEQLILAVGNDRQFSSLCKVLGLEELPKMDKYATNVNRVKNRGTLNEILQEAIQKFAITDLLAQLESEKVPAGKLNTIDEVFSLEESQKLMIKDEQGEVVGLRNFIASVDFLSKTSHISPPPPFV